MFDGLVKSIEISLRVNCAKCGHFHDYYINVIADDAKSTTKRVDVVCPECNESTEVTLTLEGTMRKRLKELQQQVSNTIPELKDIDLFGERS